MNKTKINNLVRQIVSADFVEVVGEHESVWIQWDGPAMGDPDNQILLLTWESGDILFTELGLNHASVRGNSITLEDHEGDKTHLRLWVRKPMNCKGNLKLGSKYRV